jgi:Ca2+-binding RTX toxin-like protein
MKRLFLLLVAMAVTLVVASGAALAVNKIGTNGADTLRGTNKADNLAGRGGDDTLLALAGSDTLLGGAGKDIVNGGSLAEPFGGHKNLVGGEGNDAVQGGLGSDNVVGGDGNDFMLGGEFAPPRCERHSLRRRRQRCDRRLQRSCRQGRSELRLWLRPGARWTEQISSSPTARRFSSVNVRETHSSSPYRRASWKVCILSSNEIGENWPTKVGRVGRVEYYGTGALPAVLIHRRAWKESGC